MGRLLKRSKKALAIDNESDHDDDVMGQEEVEDDDEFESEEDEDVSDGGDGSDDDEDENEEESEDDDDNDNEEKEDDENGMKRKALQDEAEMDELENEYLSLRNQQEGILSNLKRHKDEDLLKGQAVKNQKALWNKTLEFRFLLQKAFSSSNRLPEDRIKSLFCESNESVTEAYSDLITSSKKTLDSLLELEEALLEKNPSILQTTDDKKGHQAKRSQPVEISDSNGDKEWSRISQMHGRIAAFRDKSIDKWQRKSQVATGAAAIKGKLHAFNQNISEQVSTYMRDPSRMIKQMQLRRSTVSVFGTVQDEKIIPQIEETKSDSVAQADGDPELLDDSDFYQQLLKEFFESIDPASNEAAMYALRRNQTKKRKLVERRASKGRKIRYHVHEKIVNFKTRQPPPNIPSGFGSFKNLFQSKTQNVFSAN